MSDTFDHALDAFEREEMEQSEMGGDPDFYPERRKRYGIASAGVAGCVQTHDTRSVQCKRCGRSNLHWSVDRGRYRLFDTDGVQHVCEVTKNGVDSNDLYGVVDKLDDGELAELMHYCEQKLERRKGQNKS